MKFLIPLIFIWTVRPLSADINLHVHTNLQASDQNVCPHEHIEEVIVKEPCLKSYTKYVRTRKIGCNGLSASCSVREPKTVYFRTYKNVTRKRRHNEFRCCPGYEQVKGKEGCQKPTCTNDICHNGGTCISNAQNSSKLCLCPTGFQGSTCQYDVNECLVNNGGCHQACINTIGNFYCSCFPGYELGENEKCVDIDECSFENGGCQKLCINLIGGFRCDCPFGEQLGFDGRTCLNQTTCSVGNSGCEQLCDENEGKFLRCRCHAGFELAANRRNCQPIDPCSVNRCQHRCRSYNGQAQCECLPGFELAYDQRSCIAKDGCTLNNGGCEQECVQAATQYRCSCRQGFELNEDQRSCRVEMLAFTAPESLTNTIDYQTSGIKELDGLKSCIYQPEGKCHKLCMDFSTGQTFCTCQKGYFLSADDLHTCQDIDECLHVNGGCDHECVNSVGSFYCTCKDGFMLTYDQKSCEDVDECINNDANCQHTCRNTPGNFTCECFDGYMLSSDGKTCTEMTGLDYKILYDHQQQRASTTRRSSHRVLRTHEYNEQPSNEFQFVEMQDEVCEYGKFGTRCENTCNDCQNGAECNNERNGCRCRAGFQGVLCERPCVNGTYGTGCSLKCDCNGQKCNPITGQCFFGAAEHVEHLPDQTLLDIGSLPLLEIYPLASAQYACEGVQNAVKTRWFFDTRANLSAANLFEPSFEENSISTLTPGDYLCQTRNPGAQQQSAVRLNVPEYGEPPTARVEHKNLYLKHGERRRIQCHTSGTPTPKVRWVGPDSYSLPIDSFDLGNGVLEISNARKFEHEGEYKCQAANLAGSVTDRILVTVGPSLTIQITPDRPKMFVTVGSALEIKCQAFGDPSPDILWTHDAGPSRGDRPDDFSPVKISEEFILHPSVGFSNSGIYTCNASNQFTAVTKDIYVEVMDTTRHEKITIVGGTSQRFLVDRPAQILCVPSGSALVDYLVWTKNGNKLESGLETFDEPGLLYFSKFQTSEEGVYECRAYHQDAMIASRSVFVYADEKRSADDSSSTETLATLQLKLAKCKRKYAKSLKRKHGRQFAKRHARRTKRQRHHQI